MKLIYFEINVFIGFSLLKNHFKQLKNVFNNSGLNLY